MLSKLIQWYKGESDTERWEWYRDTGDLPKNRDTMDESTAIQKVELKILKTKKHEWNPPWYRDKMGEI